MLNQLDDVTQVIFITAFDEYALKACDLQSIDYILKPIDSDRLSQANKRISVEHEEFNNLDYSSHLNKLLDPNDKVFIKDG